MTEEIRPNFFRIEVPLPRNPLKSLNSYVIKGERSLVVDTGFNQPGCLEAMESGLREIGVDLDRTDFFVTHLHADHMGLVGSLRGDRDTKVFFSRIDEERLNAEDSWEIMLSYGATVGFPSEELRSALANHPGFKYSGKKGLDFTTVKEHDVLSYGGYHLRCVETPGHTRGHICLYEAKERILISGDHILGDITPHIELWTDHENTLQNYLESLDKIDLLDIDLVLPGHRSLIPDCRARIAELKEHHRSRAKEVLEVLRSGAQDAYQVAQKMSWDVKYETWETLHVAQRWFATGEAIAHLKYVEDLGFVRKVAGNETVRFELTAC